MCATYCHNNVNNRKPEILNRKNVDRSVKCARVAPMKIYNILNIAINDVCGRVLRSEQCASYRYVDDDRFVSFHRETAKARSARTIIKIFPREKKTNKQTIQLVSYRFGTEKQITIRTPPIDLNQKFHRIIFRCVSFATTFDA